MDDAIPPAHVVGCEDHRPLRGRVPGLRHALDPDAIEVSTHDPVAVPGHEVVQKPANQALVEREHQDFRVVRSPYTRPRPHDGAAAGPQGAVDGDGGQREHGERVHQHRPEPVVQPPSEDETRTEVEPDPEQCGDGGAEARTQFEGQPCVVARRRPRGYPPSIAVSAKRLPPRPS